MTCYSSFGHSWLISLFFFLFLTTAVSAIQVTPNSPCASVCLDSSNGTASDPDASTTFNSDLSCEDEDFTDTTAGQKWVSCLSCLQNSTYAEGDESDQGWFFYNLRYNVAYCVFAYPNASDVGSSPCQTSTACGPLLDAVEDGIPTMGNASEFGYCDVDSSAMTGEAYSNCLSCLSASASSVMISNALVALEAGCIQEPSTDEAVGVSGSVFASSVISITELSTSTSTSSTQSGSGTHMKTTTIAAIVIATVLGIAILCGISFVVYRKRRAQRMRRDGLGPGGGEIKINALGQGFDAVPSSAVSAGIGSLSWNSPLHSHAGSPYQPSVATMPGMECVRPDGVIARKELPPLPLQQTDLQVVPGDKKGIYPPSYETPSDSHLDKLSALPQLATSLSKTAPLAAGGHPDQSSVATASPFTHTPFQYGDHGGSYFNPSCHGSPVMATPTSATCLIPSASFASPTAQLHQKQARFHQAADAGEKTKKHLFTPTAHYFGFKKGKTMETGSPKAAQSVQVYFPGPPTRK